MTHDEYTTLREGDMVVNEKSGDRYVVTAAVKTEYSFRIVITRTVLLTELDEWGITHRSIARTAGKEYSEYLLQKAGLNKV